MSSPTTLPPLTTKDLYDTIHETTNSAGGMCSWTYAEWKLLPEFVEPIGHNKFSMPRPTHCPRILS
eukprot:4165725-Karenia_brevis.AAC.1